MGLDTNKLEDLDINEQDAFGLSEAAILLDRARQAGLNTGEMSQALENNLQLWVAIRLYAEKNSTLLNGVARDNLMRLSTYVSETTFKAAEGLTESMIDSFININLQISEGLLEGRSSQ